MNSPFVMVIFGATGDLSQNKLIPALAALHKTKVLPEDFYIIGFSRRDMTDEEFRKLFNIDPSFAKYLSYQSGEFSDKKGYSELNKKLEAIDKKVGACVTRFFYLATPPDHYETILDNLVETKLSEGCGHEGSKWTRIIVEKPFGKDLETARSLDKKLSEIFEEKQIFRVDHYLGKETVQNVLAFRFANGIFEPVWNKNFIDHVQITWGEEEGIKNRGKFFDGVGLLRDVGQNHIMQLLSAVAMESPKSFTKEDLRDARAKVIQSLRPTDEVIRGQYEDYAKEKDVAENSQTETFVAMKLFVDTPRFEGVPFYIRMGKKTPKNSVEISVVFIQTCHILFKEYGCPEIGNVLTFRIQPDEGISLRIIAKKPGEKLSLGSTDLKFTYKESFGTKGLEAYEKVLLDIFAGDQMLFNRSDELESSWTFITKILEKFKEGKISLKKYQNGTWGPKEADELIKKDGKNWL
ncbi:MAG TPA: glucose-6-phosphate dehydrogenase [Patescibacteria group bacterium]|nr:glucose-6-phosphate dehydrogenase [Patescibacteria group bacterium]